MLLVKLNNASEYMNWVADCIEYGIHYPNPYSNGDNNGLALADTFYKFNPQDAYQYFGVYTSDHSPCEYYTEEDPNIEYQDDPFVFPIDRKKLKIDMAHENELCTEIPKDSDYPIIYFTNWSDDWDRCGRIEKRFCLWFSLNKGFKPYSCVKDTKLLWEQTYKENYQKLVDQATIVYENATSIVED